MSSPFPTFPTPTTFPSPTTAAPTTAASPGPIKQLRSTKRYGCGLCPGRHYEQLRDKTKASTKNSLEHHIAIKHPEVQYWETIAFDWGRRKRHADGRTEDVPDPGSAPSIMMPEGGRGAIVAGGREKGKKGVALANSSGQTRESKRKLNRRANRNAEAAASMLAVQQGSDDEQVGFGASQEHAGSSNDRSTDPVDNVMAGSEIGEVGGRAYAWQPQDDSTMFYTSDDDNTEFGGPAYASKIPEYLLDPALFK